MAANERDGYRERRPNEGRDPNGEYDGNEKVSDEEEAARPRNSIGYKGKEDPFGDESNSEVKYRTMEWW